MASTSEIEKLERRYAENPEGRFFAPLADAYRKAGQLGRALELVQAGLLKHPDYLSAHIVLGRCLLDKGDDAGAEATFGTVLGLDPENIIALKSLAEIAERGDRIVEARRWLQKLLAVDSMNTEAEADLQRLGGMLAAEPTQPIPVVERAAEPAVSFADVAQAVETEAGPAEAAEPAPEVPAPELTEATTASMPLPFELVPPPPGPAVEAMAPEEEPAAPEPAPEPVAASAPAAAVPAPATEAEEEAEAAPAAPAPAAAGAGLVLMPFDDSLAWGTGDQPSDAGDVATVAREESLTTPAAEFLGPPPPPRVTAARPPEPVEEPPAREAEPVRTTAVGPEAVALPAAVSGADAIASLPEGPPLPPIAAFPAAVAEDGGPDLHLIMPEDVTPAEELARPSSKLVQMVSPAPASDEAPLAEPMATETLADLYRRQGFRGEAAEVYRRLLSQRPGDETLAAKLHALEGPPPNLSATSLGAESVGTWLRRVAAARVGVPPASWPPPPAPPAEAASPLETAFTAPVDLGGEPAHPAPEAFSLDQIFGAGSDAAPAPAAAPAPPEPPAPAASAGASFDEFFGEAPKQGSVRPAATPPEQAPPADEDLGAFNAWLQGLKR
jgi:hypothetical protein